ncbi:MAG: glycosyltransferase [Cyclobacteriaceae bacterium]
MIIDSLRRGGRERRMLELLKSFRKRPEIEVDVVLFSDIISYPEVHDTGYPIHILKRKPKKDPRVFFHFYHLCKEVKPDMIHSWGTMSSIYAIPACKILGIALINGNIMDAPEFLNFLDSRFFRAKLTFPFSDVILGNSQAGLRAYQAPKAKSQCIYNGFDLDRANNLDDPQLVRSRLNIQLGPVIGMVGGFYDRKDYSTFINTAIDLLRKGVEASFLAIGDGPNLEPSRSMIPLKFADRIILPGQIEQIESVINIFHIGVLATDAAVHGEGISNAIMEYMVLAKPVVATRGGGTPEIVQDGETGFLVTPGDPLELANRIEYLLSHRDKAAEMGSKGQQRIYQNFSLSQMEHKYMDLYQTVYRGLSSKKAV